MQETKTSFYRSIAFSDVVQSHVLELRALLAQLEAITKVSRSSTKRKISEKETISGPLFLTLYQLIGFLLRCSPIRCGIFLKSS